MRRKIVRLWAEYESDESPNQFIKPLSFEEAKIVIEETSGCQEHKDKEISCESIIPTRKEHSATMKFISKERMDQIEEIIRKIDHEYQENQDMSKEESEDFVRDIFG